LFVGIGIPEHEANPLSQEVDEAVRESKDPTGGRGANGHITEKLEIGNKNEEELLGSAV
jgi:hypothetical protein